jgi:hypothetical protein
MFGLSAKMSLLQLWNPLSAISREFLGTKSSETLRDRGPIDLSIGENSLAATPLVSRTFMRYAESRMEQSDRASKSLGPETTAGEPSSNAVSREINELRLAGLSDAEIREINDTDRHADHLFRDGLRIPSPRTLPNAPTVDRKLLERYIRQFDQLTPDKFAEVEGNCLNYAEWREARGQVIREILGTSRCKEAKSREDG